MVASWQIASTLLAVAPNAPAQEERNTKHSFGHLATRESTGQRCDLRLLCFAGSRSGKLEMETRLCCGLQCCHEGSTPPLIYKIIIMSDLSNSGTHLSMATLLTLTSATVRSSMIMPPPNTHQCARSQNLACRGPALRRIFQTGHHRTSHPRATEGLPKIKNP